MVSNGAQLTLVFFIYMCFCPVIIAQDLWTLNLEGLGTFSSPRCTDLNGDGTKDIVLGAGREEFVASDSAILAIDGATGQLLWNVDARDQVFGSAALKDLDGDGVMDVVIGGRSAVLKAINGKTGSVLWEFFEGASTDAPREAKWFNFYNPQFIDDIDDDQVPDILVSNGGDVLVEPYDANRPPGYLLVISGQTGEVLKKALMPDGKETYLSPICFRPTPASETKIVFGTGGETIGGNSFVVDLKDLLEEDLSKARKLSSSEDKGYIGPPVAVDLNGDQVLDLVILGVDGAVRAYNGVNFDPLWSQKIDGCEAYSSIAVGLFTDDKIPDLFISIATGIWPKLEWNRQYMLNGKNGQLEFVDSMGFYQTSSGVVLDYDGDGRDEVLLSVNFQVQDELYRKFFKNMLALIDFRSGDLLQIGDQFAGNNISSTPWIGDLDGNGYLDIIYVHATNERHTYTFDGMSVHRIETQYQIDRPLKWGAYMGSSYDGVFR